MQPGAASCLAGALLCSGKRRGNIRVRRRRRRVSSVCVCKQTSQTILSFKPQEEKKILFLLILLAVVIICPESECTWPPCGHLRKHISGSLPLPLHQVPHCECGSVLNRHPPILCQRTAPPLTAARMLQNRFIFCCPPLLWPGRETEES